MSLYHWPLRSLIIALDKYVFMSVFNLGLSITDGQNIPFPKPVSIFCCSSSETLTGIVIHSTRLLFK